MAVERGWATEAGPKGCNGRVAKKQVIYCLKL